MQDAIKRYLEDKELAWSATTKKAEGYRLAAVAAHLSKGPESLWKNIQHLAPYSRVTLWTTVTAFFSWLKPSETNPFRVFRAKNKRLFKNCYVRRPAKLSIEEAHKAIALISDAESKALALFIIESGCRFAESQTFDGGWVNGKGNKRREVLNHSAKPVNYGKSYATFRRELAKVGLKPHDLRKIHMTWLASQGADSFQLKAVAGWSDIKTAESYVNAAHLNKAKEIYARRVVSTHV
jgi:integrase